MNFFKTFAAQRCMRLGVALSLGLLLAACGGGGAGVAEAPDTPEAQAARSSSAPVGDDFESDPQTARALLIDAAASTDLPADHPAVVGALAGTGTALNPKIAMNANGVAQAVWTQYDGDSYGIWSNRYLLNVGWQTPQRVDDDLGAASDPQIAISGSGQVVAVWRQKVGQKSYVYAAASKAFGQWDYDTVQISSSNPNLGDVLNPQIVDSGNGVDLTIAWSQYNGPLVAGVRSDIWSAPCQLTDLGDAGLVCLSLLAENNDVGSAFNPQIARHGTDQVIVMWEQYKGGKTEIWANLSNVNGYNWGTPVKISSNNSGIAYLPHIAANADFSEVVAVWQQDGVWANRLQVASGTWGVPQMIGTPNFQNTGQPRIALDATGKGAVVWSQSDGTRQNIYARPYLGQGAWGTTELVEGHNGGPAVNPQIAVSPAAGGGNPVVVWSELDGTRQDIWASQKLPGVGWSAPQLIETDNTFGTANPDVAVDASGNAMAVWSQSDGTRNNILANRYEPVGKLGGQWGFPQLVEFFNGLVGSVAEALR